MSDNNDKKEISVREKEEIKKEEGEPTRSGVFYSPAVDIYENSEAITMLADIPGVEKSDLDIDIENKKLTLTGLVRNENKNPDPVYTEYGIGGYSRTFKLGDTIDQSKISASLKDGVLTLVLPKADSLKPRKIEILT